jgi:HEPN domain-containing protein
VSNFDDADRLLSIAKVYRDELTRAYEGGHWNVAVRHAQEVVELYLKMTLKMIGVEYPKSHDIGPVFTRVCIERNLGVDPEELNKINDISKNLAEKRGPAFYAERIYTQEDGEKAKADAEFVMNFAESLSKKLRAG